MICSFHTSEVWPFSSTTTYGLCQVCSSRRIRHLLTTLTVSLFSIRLLISQRTIDIICLAFALWANKLSVPMQLMLLIVIQRFPRDYSNLHCLKSSGWPCLKRLLKCPSYIHSWLVSIPIKILAKDSSQDSISTFSILCIRWIVWCCVCWICARFKGHCQLNTPFCLGGRGWGKNVHWLQIVLYVGMWKLPWFVPYLSTDCSATIELESQQRIQLYIF